MTVNSLASNVRRCVTLLGLLILWEAGARVGWVDPFYLPPPSTVGRVMFTLAVSGELWPHLGATALAAFAGLLVGLGLGIGLGFAAALSPILAELLEPVMILLNAIPRVILAPLFVIWLGIGLASKLALATVLVAVLIFFSVYNGIKEVDPRLVERIRTLGGGRRILIGEVYIPSVTAWVMGNFKVAVGFAFTGAVVGEAYPTVAEAQRAMCPPRETIYQPRQDAVEVYRQLFSLYQQLHDAFGVQGHRTELGGVMKELLALRATVRG